MGLSIFVGWLAATKREVGDDFDEFSRPYSLLNEVLAEAGMPPHHEPLDIPDHELFEAPMWGYSGLHAVRRLAAHHACQGTLPPPGPCDDYEDDAVVKRFWGQHFRYVNEKKSILRKIFLLPQRSRPKFPHIMLHSDSEGFYIPRDFEEVVFDKRKPQREGVGGMVGSSIRLLSECRQLAEMISLPADIGPNSEKIWANAEKPPADGRPWEIYAVEAFGLVHLIDGCERSIRNKAALTFG